MTLIVKCSLAPSQCHEAAVNEVAFLDADGSLRVVWNRCQHHTPALRADVKITKIKEAA